MWWGAGSRAPLPAEPVYASVSLSLSPPCHLLPLSPCLGKWGKPDWSDVCGAVWGLGVPAQLERGEWEVLPGWESREGPCEDG